MPYTDTQHHHHHIHTIYISTIMLFSLYEARVRLLLSLFLVNFSRISENVHLLHKTMGWNSLRNKILFFLSIHEAIRKKVSAHTVCSTRIVALFPFCKQFPISFANCILGMQTNHAHWLMICYKSMQKRIHRLTHTLSRNPHMTKLHSDELILKWKTMQMTNYNVNAFYCDTQNTMHNLWTKLCQELCVHCESCV